MARTPADRAAPATPADRTDRHTRTDRDTRTDHDARSDRSAPATRGDRATRADRATGAGRATRAWLRGFFRSGLRWKISAAIAVVSALVALALSLVVHNAARVSMINSTRDVQDERVQSALRIYEATGRRVFQTQLDDPALPRELKEYAAKGQRATYVQENHDGAPTVWAETPADGGKVLSLKSVFTDRYSVLVDLDQALVAGSVAVVGCGTAVGVLIGGRMSRRLRKAATAARKVADGDPTVRVREAIGGRRVRDETDELARAVDEMADALQRRLEAERRVTADIAHELRTPVTGLVTAAELLPAGRPAELVRDRVHALRTLVEDVLEVARLDGAAEHADLQEVALGDFVRRRVQALAPEATVVVDEDAVVQTDPRRLERILGNLLANAARHGRGPIEVVVDGPFVRVRDHGPGFPADLLREGPSRFRTGSSDRAGAGHGLGLTIAAGQARVLGARLTFRNVAADGEAGEGAVPGAGDDGEGGGRGVAGAVAQLLLPR
ncbi:HAMP domain-containing sensor histidine kinase [Actinacidiphila sp. DG2A-62]|uniref:sensor histidine kinase n=1 Tax=Actinacidiphila sp. DG2A-62 TaxID=3108821 RepID=UPI002DBC5925|nr:HAMP domain-containing sensor histidine kinase [Actinacidiphila sp. DG2A-62]MEC3996224.1 HAMP domain-containing sensor histidine kinase [Actinacidiphila sp. DG2A-62]